MAKTAFDNMTTKEETGTVPHMVNTLVGAGTWTLRKVDKSVGSFEIWCWRRAENIIGADRVKNKLLH
jgi:hypothetical protein